MTFLGRIFFIIKHILESSCISKTHTSISVTQRSLTRLAKSTYCKVVNE